MSTARDPNTAEIIEQLVALVGERLAPEQAPLVQKFVCQYYAGTAGDDLADVELVDLYGAALAHFNFAKQRTPGTAKLHVYNPQPEQHGWQSTHTIVEVVVDDMPFLVDSVRMALNARGLTTHLVIHPVMRVRRDPAGILVDVLEPGQTAEDALTEAIMHCEVDRQTERGSVEGICTDVERALNDVRVTVEDWAPMRAKLRETLDDLSSNPPKMRSGDLEESREFLEWVDDNHFTFIGYREFALEQDESGDHLRSIPDSGLGVLRNPEDTGQRSKAFAALPVGVRRMARNPEPLTITKGNFRSTVHRPAFLDYIGVKRFDGEGNVTGERRFLGLYTSAAYNRNPRAIPLLRKKVDSIVAKAGYPLNSHAGKALMNILETFPRDELFQIPEDQLLKSCMGILHLQERQRIRLFIHRDRFQRFFACLVYVPRERFNTGVRLQIQKILEETLNGDASEFTVSLSESVLARLYFVIRTTPGSAPDYDERSIEKQLVAVSRYWRDDLYDALLDHFGEELGTRLYRRYGDAFRADYREHYPPRVAVHDIEKMETLAATDRIAMTLYRPLEVQGNRLQFKLFRYQKPIPLSDALPMLENMGLTVKDEHPGQVKPMGDESIWVHDFGMEHAEQDLDLDQVTEIFQDAFARVWGGEVENDGFNRLVLRARLSWREIVILRAYFKYLRQAGMTFSHDYVEQALAGNAHIARLLVQLFHARFDPNASQTERDEAGPVADQIFEALDAVVNLDEDRILRSFFGVIQATLRTNFYQHAPEGAHKSYLSFKFDPAKIPELPQPKPMFEIFVYSPRVEGVHLRGGKVARGGLRWSDRREDFRTEVLGLVKAQMVKNAVIVPVGSKGGFVPKLLPVDGDREALLQEGIACYRTFISGLLDITDNIVGGAIVPPSEVVRYDQDDPYLVVAADKGTATFSDIANGIAKDYGFWLGDAFASGGSAGYDHKGMGITARGAWESVKRHFRELGVDIQNEDFTVVGVGDMGGDVFGNGMLLSEHIKLVGAFNHMHIFLDPDPDSARSFRERQRMFNLPRSSWADYDKSLISKGGGIFARSAKAIPLSPEVRQVLALERESMTPNELIKALLQAPVDLLWNGGIGTYVKARAEQHGDAGDRANDAVRTDATELRCRVVGEGGNLGLTQRARIEFAAGGGRVNTDAIDNAGGVDCSDHEVNIKILLNAVVAAGDMTEKQRNALLEQMTDEVSSLVLRNNYMQTEALSLAGRQAPHLLDVHSRLMTVLEREGKLHRAIEFLPDKEEIEERRTGGTGLTYPELAVLVAYVKINLFQDLLESDLPNDKFFLGELEEYFPKPLRLRYKDEMPRHRLWREIISTQVANSMVNHAGITFPFRMEEETGAEVSDTARAYVVARQVFQMDELWRQVELLDNKVRAQEQMEILLEARKLVERAARWLLRNRARPLDVGQTIGYFASGAAELEAALDDVVSVASRQVRDASVTRLLEARVPEALARRVAGFNELVSAFDIVMVANAVDMQITEVGSAYFKLGAILELDWLREQIVALPRANRWQALARAALRDDLYAQQSAVTADVLRLGARDTSTDARIEDWTKQNNVAVAHCRQVLADLKSGGTADFAMMSVAMREIRSLRRRESSTPPAQSQSAGPLPKTAVATKATGV